MKSPNYASINQKEAPMTNAVDETPLLDEVSKESAQGYGIGHMAKFLCAFLLGFLFSHLHEVFPVNESNNNANYTKSSSSGTANNSNSEDIPSVDNFRSFAAISHLANGAVATDQKACSEVGTHILRDLGGNAVDAAVAAALCLGVVNPASSGLGGGTFMLVHVNNTTEVVDGRETAPAAATYDMFENDDDPLASTDSGRAVGVPGELRAMELAHQRHGRLPWASVVEPAALLADGVEVSRTLADEIVNSESKVRANVWLERMLTRDDNKTLLQYGDLMKRPELARTLRAIAKEGSDVIYKGEIAQKLVDELQAYGGIITVDDLAGYRPVVREPLVVQDVSGYTLVGAPPPSSGGATVLGAIRFLAGYELPYPIRINDLSQHRLVEALKHVFAIRMSLSDPAFDEEGTNAAAVRDLLGVRGGPGNDDDFDYISYLRENCTADDGVQPLHMYGGKKWSQLKDKPANYSETVKSSTEKHNYGRARRRTSFSDQTQQQQQLRRRTRGFNYLDDHGTSHLSVVDKDRNAVSMTTTVNFHFGSGKVSASTGIVFNNEMDDFSSPGRPNTYGVAPSKANYIMPGKRPLSSMSPTLIFESLPKHNRNDVINKNNTTSTSFGPLFMSLGASGGPKIISATLQSFLNHGVLGRNLFSSVNTPRVHNQLMYNNDVVTWYDRVLGDDILPYDDETTNVTLIVPQPILDALVRRGHALAPRTYMGASQAVAVDLETGLLTAVSDVRKNGEPAGY